MRLLPKFAVRRYLHPAQLISLSFALVVCAGAAIVNLGERMDVILLATLHLKEPGVPFIAVKALSEEHARIL